MPGGDTSESLVPVGEVAGAHGVRGLLRVRLYNETSAVLGALRALTLRDRTGALATRRVTRATPHAHGLWLVGLDGIDDRTAAEALAGREVVVDAAALPPLAADEFYHHEIVGFRVVTTGGRLLGTVAHTFSTGLNDVWVVRDGRHERLVPVIADVVERIDRDARRIVIAPLDGLLD